MTIASVARSSSPVAMPQEQSGRHVPGHVTSSAPSQRSACTSRRPLPQTGGARWWAPAATAVTPRRAGRRAARLATPQPEPASPDHGATSLRFSLGAEPEREGIVGRDADTQQLAGVLRIAQPDQGVVDTVLERVELVARGTTAENTDRGIPQGDRSTRRRVAPADADRDLTHAVGGTVEIALAAVRRHDLVAIAHAECERRHRRGERTARASCGGSRRDETHRQNRPPARAETHGSHAARRDRFVPQSYENVPQHPPLPRESPPSATSALRYRHRMQAAYRSCGRAWRGDRPRRAQRT